MSLAGGTKGGRATAITPTCHKPQWSIVVSQPPRFPLKPSGLPRARPPPTSPWPGGVLVIVSHFPLNPHLAPYNLTPFIGPASPIPHPISHISYPISHISYLNPTRPGNTHQNRLRLLQNLLIRKPDHAITSPG